MPIQSNATNLPSVAGENADKTVLVFGATGQQGGSVASDLLKRGWPVRALVRDPEADKAKDLAAKGVSLVAGNFDDPASMEAAMSGVYGVFSVQPSSGQGDAYSVTDEQEIRYGKAVADIAASAGVRHLVYSSASPSGQGPTGLGHFDTKTEIEAYVRNLDMRSTIIRPAGFMELMMLPGMGLDQGAFTFFLRESQSGQTIAVQDIGKIVGAIFSDPERFTGRTIEIAGDEVTGADLQEMLTRAAGHPISYQRFPDAFLEQNPFLGQLASLFDDGRLAGNANIPALEDEFGRLTKFDEWLAGDGKPLLNAALEAGDTPVALR